MTVRVTLGCAHSFECVWARTGYKCQKDVAKTKDKLSLLTQYVFSFPYAMMRILKTV